MHAMPHYTVMIDDNFHFMDQEERVDHGRFETVPEALAACRRIVDESLRHLHEPGMTPSQLYARYRGFGYDPFVVAPAGEDRVEFSAWSYAEERCREIADASMTSDVSTT